MLNVEPNSPIRSMERDSDEWKMAWSALSYEEINQSLPDPDEAWNPEYHEGWQYMGSVRLLSGAEWAHQFRHRCHPVTNKREYRDVRSFGCSWSA